MKITEGIYDLNIPCPSCHVVTRVISFKEEPSIGYRGCEFCGYDGKATTWPVLRVTSVRYV